jgi:DNA-binding NarL/FixJ family response regulator
VRERLTNVPETGGGVSPIVSLNLLDGAAHNYKHMATVSHITRVLVAEDYEPFRRYIVSTLGKRPEWQIVGEASDGLEAVRAAEALQPDLVTLDLGLPTLNGIEAARRIRKLCPKCKILFVSQVSSADVVQEALSIGAAGYVVKARAASDLLTAVEAVLDGRLFVSDGLLGQDLTVAHPSRQRTKQP